MRTRSRASTPGRAPTRSISAPISSPLAGIHSLNVVVPHSDAASRRRSSSLPLHPNHLHLKLRGKVRVLPGPTLSSIAPLSYGNSSPERCRRFVSWLAAAGPCTATRTNPLTLPLPLLSGAPALLAPCLPEPRICGAPAKLRRGRPRCRPSRRLALFSFPPDPFPTARSRSNGRSGP